MDDNSQQGNNLNRRDALKVMLATGGALAAAAFLPAKWAKPVVEAGVVPAHAQSTSLLTVEVLEACRDVGTATIGYSDSIGMVTNASNVVIYIMPCDAVVYDGPLGNIFSSGDGFSGQLGLEFAINCTLNNIDTLCVQLFVGDRYADDCGPMGFCVA
jgi:hypothetical protein